MKSWLVILILGSLLPYATAQESSIELQKEVARQRQLFSQGASNSEDVRSAEERLKIAQVQENLASLRELYKKGQISKSEVDQAAANAAVSIAETLHRQAERQLVNAKNSASQGTATLDEVSRATVKAAMAKADLSRTERDRANLQVAQIRAKFMDDSATAAELTKARKIADSFAEAMVKDAAFAKTTRIREATAMLDRARRGFQDGIINKQQLEDAINELAAAKGQ